MKKIIVLGAGMVGSAIACDLSGFHDVCSADFNPDSLKILESGGIEIRQLDFRKKADLINAISDFDMVVGAVPGFMGFEILKTVIETGKNVVDISFFPEDAFELNEIAKSNNVTAVVDCGVAPGLSNMVLGYNAGRMEIENFLCMVGGLPTVREYPFQYKAPFSPVDVIEEYTREARLIVNGSIVTKPALSDPELVFFDGIGTLEAFNSDGLRSLLKTIKTTNMAEKTLRYPGHLEFIRMLKEAGFFSTIPIKSGNSEIIPLEFTSKILFSQWKLKPEDDEFTVMRIIIEGSAKGMPVNLEYNLFDKFDKQSGISSMARTTGYTCSAVVNLLSEGLYEQKGIIPPEYIGSDKKCFDYVINYLNQRKVNLLSEP